MIERETTLRIIKQELIDTRKQDDECQFGIALGAIYLAVSLNIITNRELHRLNKLALNASVQAKIQRHQHGAMILGKRITEFQRTNSLDRLFDGISPAPVRPTPEHVWQRLMMAFWEDNCAHFSSSTADYLEAKPAIDRLIKAGYFSNDHLGIDSDTFSVVGGDVDETAARFASEPEQYAALDAVLHRVFERGPDDGARTAAQDVAGIEFTLVHPADGETHTVALTREEVQEQMVDELYEKLGELICHCEPAGETNVVDCNCIDRIEGFEVAAHQSGGAES